MLRKLGLIKVWIKLIFLQCSKVNVTGVDNEKIACVCLNNSITSIISDYSSEFMQKCSKTRQNPLPEKCWELGTSFSKMLILITNAGCNVTSIVNL